MMPPDGHTSLRIDDSEIASTARPCLEPVAAKNPAVAPSRGLFRNWDSLFWTGENKKILINDFLIHDSRRAGSAGKAFASP